MMPVTDGNTERQEVIADTDDLLGLSPLVVGIQPWNRAEIWRVIHLPTARPLCDMAFTGKAAAIQAAQMGYALLDSPARQLLRTNSLHAMHAGFGLLESLVHGLVLRSDVILSNSI